VSLGVLEACGVWRWGFFGFFGGCLDGGVLDSVVLVFVCGGRLWCV